jgi:hypothetical protein
LLSNISEFFWKGMNSILMVNNLSLMSENSIVVVCIILAIVCVSYGQATIQS